MAAPVLLRGARQLLTLRESRGSRGGTGREKLGILEDGSLLIEDGRIRETGIWRRIGNLQVARGARQIDATGCVVLPAFIDSHVELFAGSISPPVIRKRVRSLIAQGTLLVCSSPPPNPRPMQAARAEGLEIRTDTVEETVLPLRACLSWQSCPLPPTSCIGTGFDGHTHLAASMAAAIAIAVMQGAAVEEAILAATLRPARQLGLDGELGALAPGCYADFLLLDLADYRQIPYHLGEHLVRAVYKRGVKVYERGEPYWHGESLNASPISVKGETRKR